MKDLTIRQFLDQTASSSPTPGGGSVASLSGALCTALISMVASLSVNKKGLEEHHDRMEKIINLMAFNKEILLDKIDEDIEAFSNLMEAYQLPKSDQYRSQTIQDRTKTALEVPLSIALLIDGLYETIIFIMQHGNKNVISDALIAGLLARTTVLSALCNVEINLKSYKGETEKYKQVTTKLYQNAEKFEKELIELSPYFKE